MVRTGFETLVSEKSVHARGPAAVSAEADVAQP